MMSNQSITFEAETLTLFTTFSHELADETANDKVARKEARSFEPATFLAFIQALVPIIGSLVAMCRKVPPTPPPLPEEMATRGVTEEIWKNAHDSHWATVEGYREGSGKYAPKVTKKAADQMAEREGTKRRVQKPAAIAGLNTTRLSTPEQIAITMLNAQNAV